MKVGDQGVHDLKFVSRVDEDLGPAASCFQDAVFVGGGFQGAAAGGADTDDAASGGFGVVDEFGLVFFYHVEFRMHVVLGHIIYFHRTEGAKSHMQSDMGQLYAFGLNLLQQIRGEMKTCGGCRGGAIVLGVDGL